jgi:hypothetical protein
MSDATLCPSTIKRWRAETSSSALKGTHWDFFPRTFRLDSDVGPSSPLRSCRSFRR